MHVALSFLAGKWQYDQGIECIQRKYARDEGVFLREAKRKYEEDDSGTCSSTRVLVKLLASVPNIPGSYSANKNRLGSNSDPKIVVLGVKRKMRHYHPEVITRALSKAIGEYDKIRIFPFGDLDVTCKHSKQASRLLECDILKDGTTSIPIKSSLFPQKTRKVVISGVPIEATESELVTSVKVLCRCCKTA